MSAAQVPLVLTTAITEPAPPRRPVAVLILGGVLSVLSTLASLATAQQPASGQCPPTVICHPQGAGMKFMDGMTAAAGAVGRLLNNRQNSGD